MRDLPLELARASAGILELILSCAPVLAFLFALQLVDTYKLVTFRRVLQTLAVGCGVACLCYVLNTALCAGARLPVDAWARSGAPVLEETAKAVYIYGLIRCRRLGFMVDAAICGFAVGAGFALVENLVYFLSLPSPGLATDAIRGFGTAVMHGGATAIFGIMARNRTEIRHSTKLRVALPGLAVAVLIHGLYNQPLLAPTVSAGVFLLILPGVLSLVFWRSEKALERWLGTKFDKDIDLLQMLATDSFSASPVGSYLRSLETTFPPNILGDMLCYLQLSAELSARAKGDLLRRERGFPVVPDPNLPGQLKELAFLESRIGRAGKLALAPLLGSGHLDVWEIQQLADGSINRRRNQIW